MKLWKLWANVINKDSEDPWIPSAGKVFRLIIRAETEERARKVAHQHAGRENQQIDNIPAPWLSANYSSCVEVKMDGKEEVIFAEISDDLTDDDYNDLQQSAD
jgi:hypothetical protein